MKVILWDTRQRDVQKDFAGGMGVGMHPGTGGVRGKIIQFMYRRDFRPMALNFAYLAAVIKKLGHEVQYAVDEVPAADVFILNPALMTLDIERQCVDQIRRQQPNAQILVVGKLLLRCRKLSKTVVPKCCGGEPEQLLTRWTRYWTARIPSSTSAASKTWTRCPSRTGRCSPIASSASITISGGFPPPTFNRVAVARLNAITARTS